MIALGLVLGVLLAQTGGGFGKAAIAQEVSPVKPRPRTGVYYPNTEALGPNEMRIIALGTGMPNQRPSQKASGWLVELGNGDKFLFDVGTGSTDNLAALRIPYDYLDKVFISHLHSDHMGDMDALFVGGLIGGRVRPLQVWGPSGATPELGTKAAMAGMLQMLNWDITGRAGRMPASGQELKVNEFNYKSENRPIYVDNGVVIRSWPANHVIDGAVSFSLEWNELKFVFGGDTYPNQWFVKHAKDSDVVVHECFIAVPDLVEKMNFPVDRALNVGTQIHTAPPAFGKVMSLCKPRMAIAYHFFNDFDTAPKVRQGIRSTYDGPLTLARDMMVWNVTKEKITVREVVFQEDVWPPPPATKPPPVDRSIMQNTSKWINEHNLDLGDIVKGIYDRANKMYGTDVKPDID